MSAKDAGLIIGGEPRIDFLPPEVKEGKRARKTRRTLLALVMLVVVACAAGYVFAGSLAGQAQTRLDEAQERTRFLLQEQGKYGEVRSATAEVAEIKNARLVGSATEVLWRDYLDAVVASLPAGVVINGYDVISQASQEAAPVPTVALQNARMATISFMAVFPGLTEAEAVLVNLAALPGYADAWASPISLTEDGTYTASFTLNVNSDVVERRFFAVVEEPAEPVDAEATPTEEVG